MLHATWSVVSHFLVRPLSSLLTITELVVASPSITARELVKKTRGNVTQSCGYFLAAMSLGIAFYSLAAWVLNIESPSELPVWLFNIAVIIIVFAVTMVFAVVVRTAPLIFFFKALLFAYGAAFLLCYFILAGAAVTVRTLHELSWIPNFKRGLHLFAEYKEIINKEYYDCIRGESMIFDIIYNGFGGAFESLQEPFASLSYVQPVFHVVGSVLFALIVYHAASRRPALTSAGVLVAASTVYSAIVFAAPIYGDHKWTTSACSKRALRIVRNRTAEDSARILADRLQEQVGKPGPLWTPISFEAKGNTVVHRLRINPKAVQPDQFQVMVAKLRHQLVQEYCAKGSLRDLGVSQVWTFQYDSVGAIETVVQAPESCLR